MRDATAKTPVLTLDGQYWGHADGDTTLKRLMQVARKMRAQGRAVRLFNLADSSLSFALHRLREMADFAAAVKDDLRDIQQARAAYPCINEPLWMSVREVHLRELRRTSSRAITVTV